MLKAPMMPHTTVLGLPAGEAGQKSLWRAEMSLHSAIYVTNAQLFAEITFDGEVGHGHVDRAAVCKVDLASALCHSLDTIEFHYWHNSWLAPAMQLPSVVRPIQLVG